MSKHIVIDGWLTKSPPTKRIWRTKWRRRWFTLRQSGDLPGQYFLDYYADRNCRRLKGTINLDLCEQVDAGLHMERAGNGSVDPKLRGSVFTIQTQSRIYHLEAECEEDMAKWVDAICRVCDLRCIDHNDEQLRPYQSDPIPESGDERPRAADGAGPYISISECITGVPTHGRSRGTGTFKHSHSFDGKGAVVNQPLRRFPARHQYNSQPHIRLHHAEVSENESNLSEDEANATQSNTRNWSVTKSFTRSAGNNHIRIYEDGPPVPPRPPKSYGISRDNMVYIQKEGSLGARCTGVELHDPGALQLLVPRAPRAAPPSPGRLRALPAPLPSDDDIAAAPSQSLQYCNLPPPTHPHPQPPPPPTVDRALKPRHASIGHINYLFGESLQLSPIDVKGDVLQYLDLDLHTSTSPQTKAAEAVKKLEVFHGKSHSAVEAAADANANADAECAYKTVDFLKTEAFNITRQDAEASRSNHH